MFNPKHNSHLDVRFGKQTIGSYHPVVVFGYGPSSAHGATPRPRPRRPPCIFCRRGVVPRCRRGVFACGRGASGRTGQVESISLLLCSTDRGASWASGAAQAAQVVRIFLRFAVSYWVCGGLTRLEKPDLIAPAESHQYLPALCTRYAHLDGTQSRQRERLDPQSSMMSDSDDLEAHLTEKIDHGLRPASRIRARGDRGAPTRPAPSPWAVYLSRSSSRS